MQKWEVSGWVGSGSQWLCPREVCRGVGVLTQSQSKVHGLTESLRCGQCGQSTTYVQNPMRR